MSAAPPDRPRDGRWSRRGLLAAAAAAGGGVLSACSINTDGSAGTSGSAGSSGSAGTTSTSTGPPDHSSTTPSTAGTAGTQSTQSTPSSADPGATGLATTTGPVLPQRPARWVATAAEVLPACKQAAADFVLAVMSADDRARDDALLAARLAPLGVGPEVAQPLVGLLPGSGPSALHVVYSQYGGLDPAERSASQMVVGEQLLLDRAGALVRRPFAADVRLTLDGARWLVIDVVPAYPDPPLPPLPPGVQALLDDDRVELTGVAAADLRSGVVAEPVATTLLQLAGTWRIRVHVFRSGHPVNVFPTTRPSAHAVGRAVDVTALDGIPVVDQARAPWRAFMEAALAAGATTIGGPVELAPAASSFTDRVHQDHVHLAFPRPPDRGV